MEEVKKKASAAHMKATAKYEKKAYYKVLVRFPKRLEPIIREAAGDSVHGYIVQAVKDRLQKDGYTIPSQTETEPPELEEQTEEQEE